MCNVDFSGAKPPKPEAEHSLPSSAEIIFFATVLASILQSSEWYNEWWTVKDSEGSDSDSEVLYHGSWMEALRKTMKITQYRRYLCQDSNITSPKFKSRHYRYFDLRGAVPPLHMRLNGVVIVTISPLQYEVSFRTSLYVDNFPCFEKEKRMLMRSLCCLCLSIRLCPPPLVVARQRAVRIFVCVIFSFYVRSVS
jgi:hypothetical protein